MKVAELVKRRDLLQQNIIELGFYLDKLCSSAFVDSAKKNEAYSRTLNLLFKLIDDEQSNSILLYRSNSKTNIEINNTTITMADAITIRNSMESKIDLITKLINSDEVILDVPDLIEQRNKLLNGKLVIDMAITNSDLNTEVN